MITTTKMEHAIKTQLYRWYNGYERYFTASRIANQLALLAEDIVITTPRGKVAGKTNYSWGLKDYKGMKIAHTIEDIAITPKTNGVISVAVSTIYHGIQRDGTDNCMRFTYENELTPIPNQLPLFKSIQLSVADVLGSPTFKDTYPRLRSLAVMHYYLFLIEQLQENATEFQEILTDDFQLNLSPTTVINSIKDLGTWLKGLTQKIAITSHHPNNIIVTSLSLNKYELKVDFDWEGSTVTQQKMMAKTRHTWVIIDKKNERFAKVQSINVAQLIPFTIE